MKTIQPFIDLGFHTVPLKGKLERTADGKKTIPKYEPDWKAKYQEDFNEDAATLGGTLTGSISGCIAIDCDNSLTYELFKSMDPTNRFHFVSLGKPQGGGTIMYAYPEEPLPPSFSIHDDTVSLDFYSDNGFVYLPTDKNKTKIAWKAEHFEDLPALQEIPMPVRVMLETFHDKQELERNKVNSGTLPNMQAHQIANFLAPSIELMLEKQEFVPSLFRIITPKSFRDLPQYVKHGYLHPEEIPDGRGSEYLSKVSAILGADISIDKSLYEKAMKFINELWDDPIPPKRLQSTIIRPMLTGHATVHGEPIWTYDSNWRKRGFSFINKVGEAIEVFFDDARALYYLINFTTSRIMIFSKDGDLFSYIQTIGLGLPAPKSFKELMPLVRTVSDPGKPFGFYYEDAYTRRFNTFNQTPELAIIADPAPYADQYQKPVTILKYLKTLVPNAPARAYLLKFLRKKLTGFDYSPVILYFLGAHGSGKDTFVSLIGEIIGDSYIARPSTREFLEQYNGWMVDKYIVQLDEYGNQLTRYSDKQETLGKLKAYTGKDQVQIRQMRTDGFNYKHRLTFILTANTNPLLLEENDRRAHIMETPNTLNQEEWVADLGGIGVVQEMLRAEIKDFCYYLATEVDDISDDEYVNPPMSSAKRLIIANSLPAASRIAYYLNNQMFKQLEDLCLEHEAPEVMAYAAEQRVYEDDLYELYLSMTDQAGQKRGLTAAMSDANITKVPTTRAGSKAYYYKVPSLRFYNMKAEFSEIDIDIEPIDDSKPIT